MRILIYFLTLALLQPIVLNLAVIKSIKDSKVSSITGQACCIKVYTGVSGASAAIAAQLPNGPEHLHKNIKFMQEYFWVEEESQRFLECLINQQSRLALLYKEITLDVPFFNITKETVFPYEIPHLSHPTSLQNPILLI